MGKEGFFERNFDKVIFWAFIAVFVISYTYKFGEYWQPTIPWFFFFSFLTTVQSFFGILIYPLAEVYQTLIIHDLTFLPGSLNTIYSLLMVALMLFFISSKKYELNKGFNAFLLLIFGINAVASPLINGVAINFQNYEFVHYVEAIIIFFVITTFINSKKRVRYFAWVLLLGIASLAFRLYNHVYSYDQSIPGFENNYLARMFVFYVPFFIGVMWAEKRKMMKFMAFVILGFTVQGITQLGSRATYLCLGIALSLFVIFNFFKKNTWYLVGLGLIFFMFFIGPQQRADFLSVQNIVQSGGDDPSVAGRAQAAEWGWALFREKPLTGWGMDHSRFENIVKERFGTLISGHNSFVIISFELGIFGLITYILLFLSSIFLCFRSVMLFRGNDRYLYNISIGTMFGVLAIGLNQYMLNNPWLPDVFIGFALSSVLYSLAKKDNSQPVKEGM